MLVFARFNGLRRNDEEIARYWRTVCDANRDTLRSGNVDLVYPGEIVTLPPFT